MAERSRGRNFLLCEIRVHQTRLQAQTSATMSDAEAASAAPRRSQRDKKRVERFGSGVHPPRPSVNGISMFWIHQTIRRSESGPRSPIAILPYLRLIQMLKTQEARKRTRSPRKPNRNARWHPPARPSLKLSNRRLPHRRNRGYLRPHMRRLGPKPPSERVNQRVETPENRSMPRSWRRIHTLVETTHSSVCGGPR